MDPVTPRGAICTLGMHRSGTSVVSRLLNLLGVELGPDDSLTPIAFDNPKGHWEHQSISTLNDEILEAFGGTWHTPPALPSGWWHDARLDAIRDRARAAIARDFSAAPLWGWKDPRTCLTLPFWQDLVPDLRYVICLRHPLAVAASLRERNGMDLPQAEALWVAHVEACIAGTAASSRLLVRYEEIVDDWRPTLQRLARFIGRPERAGDPAVQTAAAEFLERGLCHHRATDEDLAADARIAPATKTLYFALAGRADLAAAQTTAMVDRAADLAAERDAANAQSDRLAAARNALADERRHHITALAALTDERDRLLAQARTLADDVAAAAGRREHVERVLATIYASRAWRCIVAARRAAQVILPAGTRRRRAVDAIVERAAPRTADDVRPT